MKPTTIFKSTDFCARYKEAKTHWDEQLTHCDVNHWEPLHRLDYETSGLLLFGPKEKASIFRQQLFLGTSKGAAKKLYLAASSKALEPSLLGERLDGFQAQRHKGSKRVHFDFQADRFRSWKNLREVSLCVEALSESFQDPRFEGPHLYQVELISGARHQIRAFFEASEAPLIGDPLYGDGDNEDFLSLHSWKLEFNSPVDQQLIKIKADPIEPKIS